LAEPRSVVVVGGGVAGLATAWYLQRAGVDATVLEAADRTGGKVRSAELDGFSLDVGPDTFLGRVPWAVDLCRDLGIGEELVQPATTRAWLWSRSDLRPLPQGLALGVPLDLPALARSGVVSAGGVARAALDLVLPQSRLPADPSVADVMEARLGREVLERLVDPLIGGINAGRSDRLSLAAVAPDLAATSRRRRSLILGLRAERKKAPPSDAPLFLGLRGGMQRLTARLADEVRLESSTPVTALTRSDSGRLSVATGDGLRREADAVVLAVPARHAAGVIRGTSPGAAASLDHIRYASVAVVTLAYDPAAVSHPLDGSGFLVPRVDGRLLTACTWFSSKWPDVRPNGRVVLRCSAGRDGDERIGELDDDELVGRVHAEASEALGLPARPVEALVTRWSDAFPQYDVGHQGRVEAAERALARELPGVALVGASYRGVGIASCVRQAKEAADRLVGGTKRGRDPA
jgi:protoporphyrinogen/coproporphyrinogen III oxidase